MKELFYSSRFQALVFIAVLQVLVVLKVLDGAQVESIVQIVQSLVGAAITIRTVDRNGDKKVEAAEIATGGDSARTGY